MHGTDRMRANLALPGMAAGKLMFELQVEQHHHDETYHREIARLPMHHRLNHMASAIDWVRSRNVSGCTAGCNLVAFWSGETLLTIGDGLVEPFDPKQIDCNAYNLRMGRQYYRTADNEQKAGEEQKKSQLSP